jgi:hypothetical protein
LIPARTPHFSVQRNAERNTLRSYLDHELE